MNSFNWDDFCGRRGGAGLMEREREALRASYDYVLIDSPGGVADASNICTLQMPDMLVMPFSLNRQGIA